MPNSKSAKKELRKSEKIAFETTTYTTGDQVDSINGVSDNNKRSWVLSLKGEVLKSNLKYIKVSKNQVYEWRYELLN